MQEAATSILIGRNQQADGLNRMVVWSLAVHSMLLLGIVLMPRDWLRVAKEQEAAPMMISLGPAGQADTGGMTAITSAPVQRARAGSQASEYSSRAESAGDDHPRAGPSSPSRS